MAAFASIHNRSVLNPIILYVQDVIGLADKKWGGLEGFQQTQTKHRLARAKRKTNKDAKYHFKYAASDEGKAEQAKIVAERAAEQALIAAAPAREQALQASLAKHGLQHERGFWSYKGYLRRGVGDPEHIAVQAAHLKWLFSNTDVRMRMTCLSACILT